MFTLRYRAEAPLQPRPHAPTVATFSAYGEAVEHLDAQPDDLPLVVVQR